MATVAWLIPSLLEGSGGHRTILQHADYLQQRGHRCVLYIEDGAALSEASMRKSIRQLFGFEFDTVRLGWSKVEPADMVFATIWYSAKVVRDLPFPCVRCYFVQDYEAQFNPMGDAYLMAENSYRYGLYPIAIGRWLPAVLQRTFDVPALHFDFCADLDVYRRLPGVVRERAVCFIHQPEKPRRCAELGIEALGIVKHHMPDVKIYLYGSRAAGRVWFEHENLGLISLEACNDLYNRCQAGLCISATNPSRIPFEMMAAGLPVVEVHRDNTLYDFPEEAMLLCEPTPEALAQGLMARLNDTAEAEAAGVAGMAFMQARPLGYGLEQFGAAVTMLLTGTPPQAAAVEPLYRKSALAAETSGQWAGGGAAGRMPDADRGRLAFLPLPLRRAARSVHRGFRRLLT